MDERKETDINGQPNNVGNENIANTHHDGAPNVYAVGADPTTHQTTYTPPAGDTAHNGAYSYSSREHIPEYRYDYRQYSTTPPPPEKIVQQKKRSGKGLIIALLIVVGVLLMALASISSAFVIKVFSDDKIIEAPFIDKVEDNTVTSDTSASEDLTPETQAPSSDAIIVKNPDSVTVKTVGGQIGDETLTIPDVVALVKNSVVEIYTEVPTYNGRFVQSGAGSGVIIGKSENGKTAYVITNNHVISGAQTITVRFNNGEEYKATVCGTDANTDVAVLSIVAN